MGEVAIELATEPLDAARQVDVGTDHGEIKSVTFLHPRSSRHSIATSTALFRIGQAGEVA